MIEAISKPIRMASIEGLGALMNLVAATLVIRVYGIDQFGLFSLFIATTAILSMFVRGGLDVVGQTQVAHLTDSKLGLAEYFTFTAICLSLHSFVGALVYSLVVLKFYSALTLNFSFIYVFLFSLSLLSASEAMLRGQNRPMLSRGIVGVIRPGIFSVLVWYSTGVDLADGSGFRLIAYCYAASFVACVGLLFFNLRLSLIIPSKNLMIQHKKHYLNGLATIFPSVLSTSLLPQATILLSGLYLIDRDVGLISLVIRLTGFLNTFLLAFNHLFTTPLIKLTNAKDILALRRKAKITISASVFVVYGILVVGVALFSELFFSISGDIYKPVALLGVAYLVLALLSPDPQLFLLTGSRAYNVIIATATLFILLMLSGINAIFNTQNTTYILMSLAASLVFHGILTTVVRKKST